jgi:DNA modification methylase
MKPKQAKQKPVDVTHLRDLTPDPQNARQHNPRNIGTIVDSLHEVGAARSIVIDENNVVLAGNGVVEAAGEAGIENVRVVEASGNEIIAVRRRGLTDLQKKRLALFDNRAAELAEWSPEELSRLDKECPEALEGLFHDDELEAILDAIETPAGEADAEPQIDRAAELNKKWKVNAGDLWRIGEHRLLCGDSTKREDVERCLGARKTVIMVTDPPYGVDYDPMWRQEALGAADRRTGTVQNDDRADWSEAWKLFGGDVVYCWAGMLTAGTVLSSLSACGFVVRAELVWVKQRAPFGRGHYTAKHESCWYAVRDGATAEWIGKPMQNTVLEISHDETADGGHGTQKPLACMATPIGNHSGDVYDPFLGSGTTMVACENLKRKCRGIEISPDYCAVILERMQAAFPEIKIERA